METGDLPILAVERLPALQRPEVPVFVPIADSWYAWQLTSPSMVPMDASNDLLIFGGTEHPDPDAEKNAYLLGVARLRTQESGATEIQVSEGPIVAQSDWDAHSQNGPTVLKIGSAFMVWYQGRATAKGNTALGRATSTDGWTWVADPANPVFALEGERIAHPSIVDRGDHLALFYLGEQGMHLATSIDGGASFQPHPENPVMPELHKTPEVLWDGGRYLATFVQDDHIMWAESLDGLAWAIAPEPLLMPTGTGWQSERVANGQLLAMPEDTGSGPAAVKVVYVGVGQGTPRNGIGIALPAEVPEG
jgi:hypothetical protein